MAAKLMPGWTAVFGDFEESKAQIVRGKLESFGVPTALLDPSQTGLGYGLGRVADMQVCVPTDRVDEAREILGAELDLEPGEPQDAAATAFARVSFDGVLILLLGVLSLTGIPLFFSVAGTWKGVRYLREVDELPERPKLHRYTLGGIALCVLTIPWGLFSSYRLLEGMWNG